MRPVDFERVLKIAPRSRSAHFALHHAAVRPLPVRRVLKLAQEPELSTGNAPACAPTVDDPPEQWWLGLVVPKRHAKRSVTRSLLKRQMREAVRAMVREAVRAALQASGHPVAHGPGDEPGPSASGLPRGLWVLRLKAPFDKQRFPSAASAALRDCARAELQQLLQRATARP